MTASSPASQDLPTNPTQLPMTHSKTILARKAHPGFKAAEQSIARREGISKDRAGAILASAARNASPAAKRANPNLARVQA